MNNKFKRKEKEKDVMIKLKQFEMRKNIEWLNK